MTKLRVLMFGWEFPPYKSGGLGTACYALTKGLASNNCKVTFVMPFAPEGAKAKFVNLIGAGELAKNLRIKTIASPLRAYMTSHAYEEHVGTTVFGKKKEIYGKDIYQEVQRYSEVAKHLAKTEDYDIIHVHDWMTYQAGINAKKISKKPLVAHLHATEFDRTGGNPDPRISHLEYLGLAAADRVITNSHLSKRNIVHHYKIDPNKIDVVHWGIEQEAPAVEAPKNITDPIVLFLGRMTLQKGPDYFLSVAKKVSTYEPRARFVMAGDGDMLARMINKAAEFGLSDKVIFTGNLSGDDVHRAFKSATLYVMPSVSEPFGLVALESLKNGTPILISKQSGVSEVIQHALKADFWDIDDMTSKIVAALRYPALHADLKTHGTAEVNRFTIEKPAQATIATYQQLLKGKH